MVAAKTVAAYPGAAGRLWAVASYLPVVLVPRLANERTWARRCRYRPGRGPTLMLCFEGSSRVATVPGHRGACRPWGSPRPRCMPRHWDLLTCWPKRSHMEDGTSRWTTRGENQNLNFPNLTIKTCHLSHTNLDKINILTLVHTIISMGATESRKTKTTVTNRLLGQNNQSLVLLC